jgi:hypothetical protein
MVYTTETKVYDRTGFNSSTIQTLSGKTSAEVTTLVEGFISDAQAKIREDVEYPIRVRGERHLGDGEKNVFELGPEDDAYGSEGDYDPVNGLVEIYAVKIDTVRMKKPYPEDCELGTDSITGWSGSSATITVDTSHDVHGTNAIKCVFSGAGYVQYPNGSTTSHLDKLIDSYEFFFSHLELDDKTATITIKLYDTDGNISDETATLRQNSVGQYVWLDIDSFNTVIDWSDTRLQYIQFCVDKACTLYIDNMCFADEWAYTAPAGLFHVAVADNISSDASPSDGTSFYVDYSYDPFLASVPTMIAEASEWLAGISIIDYLRGIRYRKTSFEVFGSTLELDTDQSREGLLGVRTYMVKNYWDCLRNWGRGSYGMV